MKNQSCKLSLLALLTTALFACESTVSAASGPPTITTQPMSQTVQEGNPATFSVGVDGTAPFTFQWFRDGARLNAATNSSYILVVAGVSDNGAVFRVAVTNSQGGVVSANAVLTVNRDTNAPVVADQSPPAGATVHSLTAVEVFFSEQVVGVDASDLLINGTPATDLVVGSPSEYKFLFAQPSMQGTVQITWADGHGIHDLAATPNIFGGAGWTYTLDTNVTPSVVINEFLASNKTGLRDEDGSYSDWIELYNAGGTPVNLAGWSLTDTAANLTEWQFPSVTLLPNSYLVVFASGKNRTDPARQLHTNFQLNKQGEYLALVDPSANVVSAFEPSYPPQQDDVSYGRDRVNLGLVGFFFTPTPGAANSSGGPGFAPEVQF